MLRRQLGGARCMASWVAAGLLGSASGVDRLFSTLATPQEKCVSRRQQRPESWNQQ